MIAKLIGIVDSKGDNFININVNGVVYQAETTIAMINKYNAGDAIEAVIQYTQKEDLVTLFGFTSDYEKVIFNSLVKVSGIGGKIALAMLNNLGVSNIVDAIMNEDEKTIQTTPGIGKKTAARAIIELKSEIAKISCKFNISSDNSYNVSNVNDSIEALKIMNIYNADNVSIVKNIANANPSFTAEQILTKALQEIGSK